MLARQLRRPPSLPDTVWVTDITYLPTREGWLYLAVILDLLLTRLVVGWALSTRLDQHLALGALTHGPRPTAGFEGTLHHSDRGSQYASAAYQARPQAGVCLEHEPRGNCWDNAVAESFFATLTKELLTTGLDRPAGNCGASSSRSSRSGTIGQRRHSALGYRSPVQFEAERSKVS